MYSHKPGQPTFLVFFFFFCCQASNSLSFHCQKESRNETTSRPAPLPRLLPRASGRKGRCFAHRHTPLHPKASQRGSSSRPQPTTAGCSPPSHPHYSSSAISRRFYGPVLTPPVHAHPFFFVQLHPSPCPASGTVPFPYRPPIVPAVNDGSVPTTVTQRKIQSLLHRGKAQARLPDDRCPALNTCILLAKYYRLAR